MALEGLQSYNRHASEEGVTKTRNFGAETGASPRKWRYDWIFRDTRVSSRVPGRKLRSWWERSERFGGLRNRVFCSRSRRRRSLSFPSWKTHFDQDASRCVSIGPCFPYWRHNSRSGDRAWQTCIGSNVFTLRGYKSLQITGHYNWTQNNRARKSRWIFGFLANLRLRRIEPIARWIPNFG